MPEVFGFSLSSAVEKTLNEVMLDFHDNWLIVADKGSASSFGGKAVVYKLRGNYDSPCFELEKHEFLEICICIEGSFMLQIGNRDLELKEGNVCVLLPDVVHRELPGQKRYTAAWLSANMSQAVVHLSGKGDQIPFSIMELHVFKPNYNFLCLFDHVRTELEKKEAYYIETIKTSIIKLLIAIYRELLGSTSKSNSINWRETISNDIISYIKSKYNSHIKLDEAAQSVCISPNYLNTIFKSTTGKTIIRYHEDYRIDMAKSMLGNMNSKINDISTELGYYDQYHFSKIFKKATGMTPSGYRKRLMDLDI